MSATPNPWQVPEADNRSGEWIDPARTGPVSAQPAEEALQRQAAAVAPAQMTAQEFGATYKDWITEQNRLVEEVGIFGVEYRAW